MDQTEVVIQQLAARGAIADVRDPLTGVLTRAAFKAAIDSRLIGGGGNQSLVVIDIDRFQKVNDGFGHDTGDRVLYLAAERIRRAVGDDGFVGRTSGDEFAVFYPEQGQKASDRVDVLRCRLAQPFAAVGNAVTVTVSAGIASTAEIDGDQDQLIEAASIALHEAEKQRDDGRFYTPSMLDRARFQTALEQDLRASMAYEQTQIQRAAELEEFQLQYQPIFENSTGAIAAFEALLRWQHPVRGMVSPADFIPLAEEIGLIGQLGRWVLHTACHEAARWSRDNDAVAPGVCINVSPYQLRAGMAFLSDVQEALEASGLAAERLTVEVTESALVEDASELLMGLRRRGVRLAIDDFGTGYSSLSHILRFPFTTLKIDKYFIHSITPGAMKTTVDPDSASWLVRAIGSLSHGLGITTVAEGVENEAEAALVRDAGITHTQGFLYGRPTPRDGIPELLAATSTPVRAD